MLGVYSRPKAREMQKQMLSLRGWISFPPLPAGGRWASDGFTGAAP